MKIFSATPLGFVAVALLLVLARPAPLTASEAVHFQGRISVNGIPFTGSGLFRFALVDPDGPLPSLDLDPPSALPGTSVSLHVTKGLYTVRFGVDTVAPPAGYFARASEPRLRVWFDDGSHGLQQLSPDQPLSAVPYAHHSQSAATSQLAFRAIVADGLSASLPADRITGTLDPALVPLRLPGERFFPDHVGIGTEPDPSARLSLGGDLKVSGTVTATDFRGPGTLPWISVTDPTVETQPNQGYLAARDDGWMTFNLPATARPGDLIQISGTGKGRWWVRNAAGELLVGAGLGARWTPLATDAKRYWTAVAMSSDGGRIVAAEDGNFFGPLSTHRGGFLYTSADAGATWLRRETDFSHIWVSVAASADGQRLAAVSYGSGALQTSANAGETWTPHVLSPRVTWWRSVASSSDGQRLVAAVADGYLHVSNDAGSTWTARATDANRRWQAVASSADGQRLVAAGWDGLSTSSDAGATWVPRDANPEFHWSAVACSADGRRIVAAGREGLVTSDDFGATWTPRATDVARFWTSVASSADGRLLVAAEREGYLFTSTDAGASWTARATDAKRLWTSVACSPDGARLLAAEHNGYLHLSVLEAGGPGLLARFHFSASGEWVPATAPALGANGQLDPDLIPGLPASRIDRGTLHPDRLPPLSASMISSGMLAPERIPSYLPDVRMFEGPVTIGDVQTSFAMLTVAGDLDVRGTLFARSVRGPGILTWESVAASDVNLLPNQGYQAARDVGLTTFTLPATAEVGDVIRIVGTGSGDWWVRDAAGNLVVGGPAGLAWTARATDERRAWWSIASSTDGRQLVAATLGGFLYTSVDAGASWIARATDLPRAWSSVACSADGTRLLASEMPGQLHASFDTGRSWTPRATDALRPWTAVASSSDGNRLVAVEDYGNLFTSANTGVSWSPRPTGAQRAWRAVASSADGNRLLAAEAAGTLHRSTDAGATWTAVATDAARAWVSVASSSDGQRLAAAERGGFLHVSADAGATWSPCLTDLARAWVSIASSADGLRLVAAMHNGFLFVSTDGGLNWTPRATDAARAWKAVASSADGQRLVAIEGNGYIYTSESRAGGRGDSVEFFRDAGGQWIPVSSSTLSVPGTPTSASPGIAGRDGELESIRGQLRRLQARLETLLEARDDAPSR